MCVFFFELFLVVVAPGGLHTGTVRYFRNVEHLGRDVKCCGSDIDETEAERRGLNPVSDQSESWISQAGALTDCCVDRLLR